MKDKGVSKQEALSKFEEIVENGWKDANAEWVKSSCCPKELLLQFLNYGRAGELTYKNYEDGYSCPENNFNSAIRALLLDPMLI